MQSKGLPSSSTEVDEIEQIPSLFVSLQVEGDATDEEMDDSLKLFRNRSARCPISSDGSLLAEGLFKFVLLFNGDVLVEEVTTVSLVIFDGVSGGVGGAS